MTFRMIFTLLFLLYPILSISQVTNVPFFKISKNGKSSYILGTIHVGFSMSELPQHVLYHYNSSEILINEVLISEDSDVAKSFLNQSINLKGTGTENLKTLLSKESWLKLLSLNPLIETEQLESYSPAEAFYCTMKSVQISLTKSLAHSNVDLSVLDLELASNSWNKRELKGLETREEFIQILDSFINAEHLNDFLLKFNPTDIDFNKMVLPLLHVYKNGPHEALAMPSSKLKLKLMDERNKLWAPRVDLIHKNYSRAFFAVGSAHLFGEGNLPDELEKLGFEVEKVEFTTPQ